MKMNSDRDSESISASEGNEEFEDTEYQSGKKIIVPVIWRKGSANLLLVKDRYVLVESENVGADLLLYAAGKYLMQKELQRYRRSFVAAKPMFVVPGQNYLLVVVNVGGAEAKVYKLDLADSYEDEGGLLWMIEAKEISLEEFVEEHAELGATERGPSGAGASGAGGGDVKEQAVKAEAAFEGE
ncbi:MAG: hypothetical protein ACP5MH_10535, partial [Thermoproteus sp.]